MSGICFLGDVMLGREVGRSTSEPALVAAIDGIRAGRRVVLNLECCVAATGERNALAHSAFDAPENLVRSLGRSGVVAASIANNHSLDFGATGLEQTIATVASTGIAPLGRFGSEERPQVFTLRDGATTIHVVACCGLTLPARVWRAGIVPAGSPEVLDTVRELSARGDLVVVFVHWGHEMLTVPPPEVRALAGRLADAGARLVVGHGPHVVQGHETIGKTDVYYSLGDAVFDRSAIPDRSWGLAVYLDLDGENACVRARAFALDPVRHVPDPTARPDLDATFATRSASLGDVAQYRRIYLAQAGHGFIGQQVRTTLRLVRSAGPRGLLEKLRGLRMRHVRLLLYTAFRMGR